MIWSYGDGVTSVKRCNKCSECPSDGLGPGTTLTDRGGGDKGGTWQAKGVQCLEKLIMVHFRHWIDDCPGVLI